MEEKDLERLTATKLREIAKQYEEIKGAHAMKKEQLIIAIRKARGEDVISIASSGDAGKRVGTLKKQIKNLREEKEAAQEKRDKKAVTRLRKRIKKYRRLTRRIARAKAT